MVPDSEINGGKSPKRDRTSVQRSLPGHWQLATPVTMLSTMPGSEQVLYEGKPADTIVIIIDVVIVAQDMRIDPSIVKGAGAILCVGRSSRSQPTAAAASGSWRQEGGGPHEGGPRGPSHSGLGESR